ncbi:blast:Probable E3 ubiquitin-protein ligase RNF144A-A [Drosophila guanche]|uniref:E3 ubiquitin-protein ligase RNF144B n=1 Tax=Drosophila guanche TaxID=7266 RepID=A0A3B0JSQ4_DROGU|nr:blast:Probable E3 ubiquitin-protein ligase RNF144A-A [Drosophila guanche]
MALIKMLLPLPGTVKDLCSIANSLSSHIIECSYALSQYEATNAANVHVHAHATPLQAQAQAQQQLQQQKQQRKHQNPTELDADRSLPQHARHATHNSKLLPPLELLVENKISYSGSAVTYHQSRDLRSHSHSHSRAANKRNSLSSPSSSEECCVSAARASIFDDAAENFNSASLIFTKKELGQGHSHSQRRQHHSSLYGAGGERAIRKTTKHLPPTRGQHQRRSLPLSYSHAYASNLVTTAGTNYAPNGAGTGTGAGAGAGAGGSIAGGKLVPHKHHQHQHQHHGLGLNSPTANSGVGAAGGGGVPPPAHAARKQLSYSWYAPVYSALEEELEQDSRDSSPIHNLANAKQHQRSASQKATSGSASVSAANALHATSHLEEHAHEAETVALLETQTQRNKIIISSANGDAGGASGLSRGGGVGIGGGGGSAGALAGHDLESSLGLSGGGQLPRRRRFENFLKSLVGLKASSSSGSSNSSSSREREREREKDKDWETGLQRPASPEIRITRTPSEQDVVLRDPAGRQQLANGHPRGSLSISGSSSSLNVVQHKLWHIMRREGSASSLHQEKSQSIVQYTGLRKCETVLALTRQGQSQLGLGLSQSRSQGHSMAGHGSGIFSSAGIEQIRPLNRLRNSVNSINGPGGVGGVGTCSRCSSLLSLAASGSRYSLANGFVVRPDSAAGGEEEQPHINVNAQIRLSGGAVSAPSSSPSPPSNVTTATLHSSSNNNLFHGKEEEQQQQQQQQQQEEQQKDEQTTPTAGELGPFGTQHAYPLTVSSLLSMASANQAAKACCVRDGITLQRREMLASSDVTPSATPTSNFQPFTCKLCLIDVEDAAEAMSLQQCDCQFCIECMRAYVEFEISEGAYEISCPDAKCPAQGAISLPEIANLTTTNLLKKHHRYRLNREIELDKTRTWCPRAGCETICMVGGSAQGQASAICQMDESPSTSQSYTPQLEGGGGATVGVASEGGPGAGAGAAVLSLSVHCPSCKDEFCALCKKAYHPNISCEEFGRRLIADGQDDIGIPFDNELIKCCPMCAVPIEKDEGCAQMMCKRCKHVFCWYCLASLDDDFLLRHYDKGPCKNKLGHSRASVVWHRAQVIGIFAGFGILLLVASPLLLLAAPCIICCKCRGCSGSKIDEVDAELEEEVTALQG